jgi:hypothetical protein
MFVQLSDSYCVTAPSTPFPLRSGNDGATHPPIGFCLVPVATRWSRSRWTRRRVAILSLRGSRDALARLPGRHLWPYNENKQAYITDVKAGTCAQLVEAAESCQVSIIRPGKPRDPNLPDLMRHAEAFQ